MYGYNLLLGEAVVMKKIAIIVILAGLSYISVSDSLNRHRNTQAKAESRFMTQVQSEAVYVRHSMLSRTPHYSGGSTST